MSDEVSQRCDAVLERIADGEAVNAICTSKELPTSRTIFRRAQEDDAFRKDYDLACRIRAERYAEELVTLADTAKNATSPEEVQAIKLRVNTRQWVVSKLLSKKYGDKTGDVNVSVTSNNLVISEEQRRELMKRVKRLREETPDRKEHGT